MQRQNYTDFDTQACNFIPNHFDFTNTFSVIINKFKTPPPTNISGMIVHEFTITHVKPEDFNQITNIKFYMDTGDVFNTKPKLIEENGYTHLTIEPCEKTFNRVVNNVRIKDIYRVNTDGSETSLYVPPRSCLKYDISFFEHINPVEKTDYTPLVLFLTMMSAYILLK
jgi:hypothetical protein